MYLSPALSHTNIHTYIHTYIISALSGINSNDDEEQWKKKKMANNKHHHHHHHVAASSSRSPVGSQVAQHLSHKTSQAALHVLRQARSVFVGHSRPLLALAHQRFNQSRALLSKAWSALLTHLAQASASIRRMMMRCNRFVTDVATEIKGRGSRKWMGLIKGMKRMQVVPRGEKEKEKEQSGGRMMMMIEGYRFPQVGR